MVPNLSLLRMFRTTYKHNKKGAHTCSMGIPASHLVLGLKVRIFRSKTQSECFNIFEVFAKIT
jgi:hypothetical protein